MSSILIKNIGTLVTGKLESPLEQADSIFINDGVIQAIGKDLTRAADHTVDANGIAAIPGLIDSHSHPSIGEYTPAQNSLSWITNYMHGGVTALISAGELHLPGLPLPPDARTALSVAIVTRRCYDNLRPSGVKVNAGTLGGKGIIAGAVTAGTGSGAGAFLAPSVGAGQPAKLTIQSPLTFKADGTLHLQAQHQESQSRSGGGQWRDDRQRRAV